MKAVALFILGLPLAVGGGMLLSDLYCKSIAKAVGEAYVRSLNNQAAAFKTPPGCISWSDNRILINSNSYQCSYGDFSELVTNRVFLRLYTAGAFTCP